VYAKEGAKGKLVEIIQIPVLNDNFIYVIHDNQSGDTAVIDPALADPVLNLLKEKGWTLTHIWNTHHHFDHVGANLELKEATDCTIVGAAIDQARIPGIDVRVNEGDYVSLGDHLAEVIFVPGHTSGHIAYWFNRSKVLFIGDTLFAMGCGRLFEGTAKDMWTSLSKLKELPDDTLVYCAHEYTLQNGKFAQSLETSNEALNNRMAKCEELRNNNKQTIPFTLGEDRTTNPFLRADDPVLQNAIGMVGRDVVEVFAEIRSRKDHF
jgi:hydroxyacylglutathione hydrolase